MPESRIPNPESRIPNPESRIPNPDSRFPIPESRFPIPESRFPIPDSRFPIPDSAKPCVAYTETVSHYPAASATMGKNDGEGENGLCLRRVRCRVHQVAGAVHRMRCLEHAERNRARKRHPGRQDIASGIAA
ncbi:hypothetical protein XACW160_260121 [Xanthomonas citri pv. citri]|nr:hypothetical protein XACW160_260121 [Xanthomonas citri pv. citri]